MPKKEGVCDRCGGGLYQRDDDKPDAIAKRLKTFHDETEPLKDFYEKQGVLRVVYGVRPIDETFKANSAILNSMLGIMNERAEALGGLLRIDSPGVGTRVMVEIPLGNSNHPG